ncbi:mitogen-activated protein kinase 7-like [Haliotis rufescens]|uniref:mitogen-activated protein kinase 7-like n=1 Tax=Haliotis rufescens TaxID=6454 RepID=UPI00201E97BC|nr:mitogen-activated protein kinase 7-like [Haliotis rufescens]XP_046374435.2 mitogen-activated protein kinase 7-like [Haliotis rufescens]XP_046374436.2 mitogen-activated protein kinase 7-like [Haliotis rufescens]XP_046374438.2 mitogen-activated protein kinase 7-like [Haliotis rufescens]XP_046374439.2 mitogen-activated protein kinase 7-like [Haliotis rufescens]
MTSTTPTNNMTRVALDQIKKNLAKRTFSVKFDLQDTDYKPIENIGIGAYGVVCSATHRKTQDRVAIKKIPHVFDALTVTKRTYREIKILKHFNHDNIINIREILKPKQELFQEIYVVFDLMESDLHRIIYTQQELTEEHIRYFLYQILRGLKYIHSANVIHRDLKPSNLLVNEDCHVRIGDFGMARGIFQTPDEPCYYMTQYVATRWYRAPEILLSLVEYGTAVDMWSVGCIFAEMLGRKHLFPGKDYISQIKLIVGVLGSPTEAVLKNCENDLIKRILKALGHRQAVPWKTLFPKASKKAIDLLSKMLTINPAERMTVEKALEHHYLSKYHDPDDEPICVPTFNFDFEKKDMSKDDLKEVIYKEIMDFHQPKTPTLSFNAVLRPAPKPESPQEPEVVKGDSEHLDDLLKALQQQQQQQQTKAGKHDDMKAEATHTVKQEDKVFKKPMPQRSSIVTVDTNALVPPHSVDIEMLSAKSTDGKQEMDIMPVIKAEVKGEDGKQQPQTKQQHVEIKTISSDTKALVKQALLNASQRRQRTDSTSEDTEGKRVVTAAQRQKEREDKRKKKRVRANERVRRQKEKQNQNVLSNEDKELLKRWACMQKIAPATGVPAGQLGGPQVNNPTVTHSLAISLQGNSLTLTPMTQQPLQPAHLQTLQVQPALPTSQVQIQTVQLQGGQVPTLQIQGHQGAQTVQIQEPVSVPTVATSTVPSHQPAVISSTEGKSQLHAGTPSHTQSGESVHPVNTQSPPSQHIHQTLPPGSISLQQDTQTMSLPAAPLDNTQLQVDINHMHSLLTAADTSTSTGCMFQSTEAPPTGFSVPNVNVSNQTTLPSQVQQFINPVASHTVMQKSVVDTPCLNHNNTTNGQYCHSNTTVPVSTLNSNVSQSSDTVTSPGFSTITLDGLDFFNNMGLQSDTQQTPTVETALDFQPYPDQLPESRTSPPKRRSLDTGYQSSPTFPVEGVAMVHSNSAPHFTQMSSSSGSPEHTPYVGQPSFTNQSVPFSNYLNEQSGTNPSFSGKEVAVHLLGKTSPDQASGVSSRNTSALKIKCNSPPQAHAQPDLIALLSKQLSKSQVEDIFPPSLSLTPKGTGGGYGVGADLDALMVDAESARLEQSPLSSSLLADWMDLRGNISQADLEALEHELGLPSPMAVSYSDVSLNHSEHRF